MSQQVTQPTQATTTEGNPQPTAQTVLGQAAAEPAKPAEPPKPDPAPAAPPAEPPKPVVPEKYDFKLGEDSLLDSSDLEKIAALSKERGFSQEQAEKYAQDLNASRAVYAERMQAQHNELVQTKWPEMIKADKEIGGENFKQSVHFANTAIKKFASPEFIKELDDSGFGNHPGLVKLFARIGKAMSDDTFVTSNSQGTQKKDIAEILYGKK